MAPFRPTLAVRACYDRFDAPVTALDCGAMCAPHNPSGKPFCCHICHAVPAAYREEWDYLKKNTDLWSRWRGDECGEGSTEHLRAETPPQMRLLACQGPSFCQRPFRALSCRQFPFFPYVDSQFRFLGLAYEWAFEPVCWVISNLGMVTETYREQFVRAFDDLFSLWPEEMDAYAIHSEDLRARFVAEKRRFPLLHRNGGWYLVSPSSERMRRAGPQSLPRFGPYR